MGKLILVDEDDLRGLINEALTNAVDSITKKIAAGAAVRFYNNEIFSSRRTRNRCVVHHDEIPISCGGSSGCGSSSSVSYGSCGSSGGGCGSSIPSGGCGGGNTSGGC